MTAPKLTPSQRRALLWLAETPGEWRYMHQSGHQIGSVAVLVRLGLAERRIGQFRATPAGLALAKEIR